MSEAFGKATISANASTEINIRFPGQYYDKETGTHYNLHRDYDPSTGRYLQSDPIGLGDGENYYLYSYASPILNYDSTGKAVGAAIGIGGRIIGGRAFVGWVGSAGARLGPWGRLLVCLATTVCSIQKEECEEEKINCRKASKKELEDLGIDPHEYKDEHGARPVSRWDICICSDGSIRIARVGMCGRTNDFWW